MMDQTCLQTRPEQSPIEFCEPPEPAPLDLDDLRLRYVDLAH